MNSQAVVLATAMVVSSTVLFLAFGKQKLHLRRIKMILQAKLYGLACIQEKKRQKKKKRVHFAENVKETSGNGKEYRKERSKNFMNKVDRNCRNEIPGMPANRVALYNGILRDRVHRTQCSC